MNFYSIQLEVILIILSLSTLLASVFIPSLSPRKTGLTLAACVAVLFVYSFSLKPLSHPGLFNGLFMLDSYSLFFKRVLLGSLSLLMVLSSEFVNKFDSGKNEFYALILLASAGMLVMCSSNDFILLFVALELVTICFYILTSFSRNQRSSLEAGIKYLILGALSSGLLIYGISYIYGSTGTTKFFQLIEQIQLGNPGYSYQFGIILVFLSFLFKVAAFPMLFWAPDVYQGSPTPVTAFLATGSKIAGFAVLMRLFLTGLIPPYLLILVLIITGLTLLYGNLGALKQTSFKRLLGYSSIGHAGYLFLGISSWSAQGVSAILFYLAQYAITSLALFLALTVYESSTNTDSIDSLKGLHKRSPLLALVFLAGLASLAGLPPFSGFFAKFQLFLSIMQPSAYITGNPPAFIIFFSLAILAGITVVISLYFYFTIVKTMYMEDPDTHSISLPPLSLSSKATLILCFSLIFLIGVFQNPLVEASRNAIMPFLGH